MIVETLAKVSAEVGAVRKGDRNEHQRFNFRGIDAVVNACHPVLTRHGIVVVPEVLAHEYDQLEVGKNRTLSGHCRLLVAFHFCLGDERLTATVASEAMDSGDKAYPKAMSVALRTALLQTLMLPTDETDPDASTYTRAPRQAPVTPTDDGLALVAAATTEDELRALWSHQELHAAILARRAELA